MSMYIVQVKCKVCVGNESNTLKICSPIKLYNLKTLTIIYYVDVYMLQYTPTNTCTQCFICDPRTIETTVEQ